jgi:hypothetical protein
MFLVLALFGGCIVFCSRQKIPMVSPSTSSNSARQAMARYATTRTAQVMEHSENVDCAENPSFLQQSADFSVAVEERMDRLALGMKAV